LAICGLATSQFGQRADLAAFGAGLGAFALGLAAPRFALVAVSGLLAVWMLAAPFATPVLLAQTDLAERLPFSLAHRIGIWEYVCNRIGESPWIGHGLDASSAVDDKIMVQGKESSAISLHPHSASLQIWFETGAVGALLAAAALLTAGWRLSSALADNRAAAAAVCGALASYGLLANVSWEAWHEWRQAAMLLCASVIAAFAPQTDYAAASWHMANRAHKKR
jgi:O-antigen ligase